MADYDVKINASAEKDLASIVGCTAVILKEPVSAEHLYMALKDEIKALQRIPEKHPVVREAPYVAQGLRKMPVDDYSVFYVVSEEEKTVFILRILFNRAEWNYLLRDQ